MIGPALGALPKSSIVLILGAHLPGEILLSLGTQMPGPGIPGVDFELSGELVLEKSAVRPKQPDPAGNGFCCSRVHIDLAPGVGLSEFLFSLEWDHAFI